MKLGITDCLNPTKFDKYVAWMNSFGHELEIVKLSHEAEKKVDVSMLDGLLLTGGGDVDPELYGKIEERPRARSMNQGRDQFEIDVLSRALDDELPILGVCRGMQITNVFLGGTLWVDLPSQGFENHSEVDGKECRHPVATIPHSLLHAITGAKELSVNSSHHQAVDELGRGLMKSALSRDGVTEALEWALKDSMPFILLVQWHPERMADKDNPACRKIGEIFLHEMALRLGHASPIS